MIFSGVLHYLSTVIYVIYVEDNVDHLLFFSLITYFFVSTVVSQTLMSNMRMKWTFMKPLMKM